MTQIVNYVKLHLAFQDKILEHIDMRPTHIAVYNALFAINNAQNWIRVFPVEFGEVIARSKVDKDTYYRALNYLNQNGFLDLYEKGKSKYSRARVSLKLLYEISEGETDSERDTYGELNKDGEREHLIKPLNNKPYKHETSKPIELFSSESDQYSFEIFWDLYDKKVGDKKKLEKKWATVRLEDRKKIFTHIPLYKKSQPDKKFRKHPETYLNNESWKDEIIKQSNGKENRSITKVINPATISKERYFEPL